MHTAFAYARVSTKEQAAKDNSIPEQFTRIQRYAKENDIEIIRQYQDSDSAFHDTREQFQTMIDDAILLRPSYIITDDSSRFARTRKTAIETKQRLRSHGVNIRTVNEPYLDPKSVSGLWLEGIQEIKNEATSREIAFHAWKGMSHNIQNRDPQSGWCYKNGGRSPFGYKIVYVTYGQNLSGRPLLKSYWEMDEETGPIAHEIIVDMYAVKRMSYLKIRDELNHRRIPSPKGGFWSQGTIVDMLSEHRLEQYAGTAIWNKEAERDIVGQKYKPRDKWIVVENAHPAIITKEELETAIARKKQNRKVAVYGATRESQHLLTGTNFEHKSMFTCAHCGGNVIGYANNNVKWRKYVCGEHRRKGTIACDSDWLIDATWLEQRLVSEIEQRYTTPDRVDELISNITKSVQTKHSEFDKMVDGYNKQAKECDVQIKRLLDAIKSGVDASLISDEVNGLKQKKDDLESQIAALKKSYTKDDHIDPNVLRSFFVNFTTAYSNATIQEKRDLIRTFIRHIELVPETKEIRAEFYPDQTVQSIGVGEASQLKKLSITAKIKFKK